MNMTVNLPIFVLYIKPHVISYVLDWSVSQVGHMYVSKVVLNLEPISEKTSINTINQLNTHLV